MKRVAILQFAADDGPGYFRNHLADRSIPYSIIRIDAHDPVPADASDWAGIGLMGGPMSANDPLPWIGPVLDLVRGAVDANVPVVGHCLGAQLMSKALGGTVHANPVKEIGWGAMRVLAGRASLSWFGEIEQFESFHWHGETFTLPAGAVRLAASDFCRNQAFALGPHLGLQCHIEMTTEAILSWCETGRAEIEASSGPAVQSVQMILSRIEVNLVRLRAVAIHLYDRWLQGVRRTTQRGGSGGGRRCPVTLRPP